MMIKRKCKPNQSKNVIKAVLPFQILKRTETMDFEGIHTCAMRLIKNLERPPKGADRDYALQNLRLCETQFPLLYEVRASKDGIMACLHTLALQIEEAARSTDRAFDDETLPANVEQCLFALAHMRRAERKRFEASRIRIKALEIATENMRALRTQKRLASDFCTSVSEAEAKRQRA